MIQRREFITLLGGAAAWPLAAGAQQIAPMRQIAILGVDDPVQNALGMEFRKELAVLGWIEGRNLMIDLRLATAGDFEGIRAIAAGLVRLGPEAIFVSGGLTTRTIQQQTQTIPIVFVGASNADETVKNVVRPEGNITGFHILYPSIGGKWLELLKQAAPELARVATISSVASGAGAANYFGAIEAAGRVLGVKTTSIRFESDDDLVRKIGSFAADSDGGLIILPGEYTGSRGIRQLLILLAARYRVPVIYWNKEYPSEGGLLSYGSESADMYRGAARYMDRILRGAKIIDLPVQFPTKFQLVVNLKAAKAIGLTAPQTLLAAADEVIE
jgi:putative ABC transport system substrate-binding protein